MSLSPFSVCRTQLLVLMRPTFIPVHFPVKFQPTFRSKPAKPGSKQRAVKSQRQPCKSTLVWTGASFRPFVRSLLSFVHRPRSVRAYYACQVRSALLSFLACLADIETGQREARWRSGCCRTPQASSQPERDQQLQGIARLSESPTTARIVQDVQVSLVEG